MNAIITKFKPKGVVTAPPSKSMAHRYLIGAALAEQKSVLSGIDYSEDILATIGGVAPLCKGGCHGTAVTGGL